MGKQFALAGCCPNGVDVSKSPLREGAALRFRQGLGNHLMKTLLAAILSAALLSVTAHAQSSGPNSAKASSIPKYTNKSSGRRIAAPNRARVYGVDQSGKKVNPDQVPPLSPGGQGLAPEAR
jgi:hypothetical protein